MTRSWTSVNKYLLNASDFTKKYFSKHTIFYEKQVKNVLVLLSVISLYEFWLKFVFGCLVVLGLTAV